MTLASLKNAELGKKSAYPTHYDPSLLLALPRQPKRDECNLPTPLPFYGRDVWWAYELSWLNPHGKPMVAVATLSFDALAPNLIESKSLKLYFNSLNMATWPSPQALQAQLIHDLTEASGAPVLVDMTSIDDQPMVLSGAWPGHCIDHQDIACHDYTVKPDLLKTHADTADETLYTHLLKSNCLVTAQPDWGSMLITYSGPRIDQAGLLRYIVSYRNHPEFHEQCVERCFWDIWQYCKPTTLTVQAQYTRRGGLDINPIRSTEPVPPTWQPQRTIRQ